MNSTAYRLSAILFLAGLTTTVACSDDGPEGPEGTYAATELILSEDGDETDLLAAGTELTITLTAAGTTTGTLVVPAEFTESGTEETFSLEGTYDYDEDTGVVTFDHDADTFIRDTDWTLDGDELQGSFVDGTTSVTATLVR
jgi:hypothetical protein